jgi:hypothetical protein
MLVVQSGFVEGVYGKGEFYQAQYKVRCRPLLSLHPCVPLFPLR